MSKRNKLQKFEALAMFEHVRECPDPTKPELFHKHEKIDSLAGKWGKELFKNSNKIVLELACGRGEYTIALAEKYPDCNFIGVDIKGARLFQGATISIEKGLKNVGFLRTRIEVIEHFFAANEISAIWITFPDPFHKKENRRLSAANFLAKFNQFLVPDGVLNIKTDDDEFYDFSKESLETNPNWDLEYFNADIYSSALENTDLEIKTYYEKMHLDSKKRIKYLKASHKPNN